MKPPAPQPEGPVVLNVDDTEAIRYAKSRTLKRAGYAVIEAGTGAEALMQMQAHRPALALLDVKLPDMSGLQVCEIIKRDYPQTLVLQISATHVSTADKVKGLGAGADSYLTQPVEPDELAAAVAALLRLREGHVELRKANEGLEAQVAERTEELASANRQLRGEIEERSRVEASLRQAQKMEAVGHLTGGIAHDFNNLLMAVMGNLDILKRRLGDGRTDVESFVDNAMTASKRAAALTQRLLAFARRQPLAREAVEVSRLVDELQPVLRTTLGASVEVSFEGGPDLWPVWCDRHQLENALLNLIINARDAMPNGGRVSVTAANVTLDRGAASAAGQCAPGDYVRIAVEDEGEGMSPEVQERVFEPFFTTKPVGQGTGLGLSMLYGFVRQSGGAVQIRSAVGEGTEVALLLPRVVAQVVQAAAAERISGDAALGHGETVLLVEDEPLVAGLMTEALVSAGYHCIEVGDAREAIAVVEGGQRVDLLLTDIGLPGGMDGLTLAAKLRGADPALRVLFASGHAAADAGEAQGAPVLQKPFDMIRLIDEIRKVLAA